MAEPPHKTIDEVDEYVTALSKKVGAVMHHKPLALVALAFDTILQNHPELYTQLLLVEKYGPLEYAKRHLEANTKLPTTLKLVKK